MTILRGGLETSGVFEKVTGCQEDGFVGVLKKYVPDRLALMGLIPSFRLGLFVSCPLPARTEGRD